MISLKRIVRSIHVAMILYVSILNVWRHIRGKIASGVAEGDDGVAGKGRVVDVPKFHSWVNEYQLRLDVQRFLWPVNYIALYIICDKNPALPANIEFELEAILSVQVVFQIIAPRCYKEIALYHTELWSLVVLL